MNETNKVFTYFEDEKKTSICERIVLELQKVSKIIVLST